MQTFELNVFIDCPRREVYEHISNPLNMIGLRPLLTTIDLLKEKRDPDGTLLRPFYILEVFRWAGLPVFRNRVYSVIRLTNPGEELELHEYHWQNLHLAFRYTLTQDKDQRTHLKQTIRFVQGNKLLENFVIHRANQTQRALLSNLKVRLEKK